MLWAQAKGFYAHISNIVKNLTKYFNTGKENKQPSCTVALLL